ncbi:MAG: PPC domain-containing protein [Gemmatimonadaceae bacterium]
MTPQRFLALLLLVVTATCGTDPVRVPAKVGFQAQPTDAVAGVVLAPSVTVLIQDADGRTVDGADLDVTLTITAGTGGTGAALRGTTTVTAVNGAATFAGLTIEKAGTDYTLTATSGNLTSATSGMFTITHGPAAKLAVGVQPLSTTAGTVLSPAPQILVQDAFANMVTSALTIITVRITTGSGSSGAILSGTSVATPANGVATFPNLSINKSGSGYSFTATSAALTATTTNGFDVTPAVPTKLVVVTQPNNVDATAAITPGVQVAVQDAFNNTVTTATTSIGVAITPGSGAAGATLAGTRTQTAIDGIATFSNLTIDKSASNYTLQLSATALTSTTTSVFAVTAGAPTKLGFVTQPSTVTAGSSMFPSLQVAMQDAAGNTVSVSTVSVGIALTSGTGTAGAVLGGTLTRQTLSGIATFSGLSIDKVGTGYSFTATSASLTSAISAAFNVVPLPTQLVFVVQPADAAADDPITPALQVEVRDAQGARISAATTSVTLAITSSTGTAGAVLTGTKTRNAVGGIATFSGLSIDRTGSDYMLTATASGLTSATTSTFSITPPVPIVLLNDATVHGLSGSIGGERFYRITVPAGATDLTVATSSSAGATGDADLYVRRGDVPAVSTADCSSVNVGRDEVCAFSNPADGEWYVMVRGLTSYTGVSARATYRTAATSFNFSIDGVHLTQGTQTFSGDVPLVAGRPALLRVFVRASHPTTAIPAVRVRLYRAGSLVGTYTINSSIAFVPTASSEGSLTESWNVDVGAEVMQTGLSVLADVDPAGAISEFNESDNSFPISGTPAALDVRVVQPFRVMLVPVLQQPNGREGDVNSANTSTFTEFTNRVYPFATIDASVHSTYTFTGSLPTSYDSEWSRLLSEMRTLQVGEGTGRYYYGVLKPAAFQGGSGLGYLGLPAAIGVDWVNGIDPNDNPSTNTSWRSMTAAHEWGHNFNRRHVNCGGATGNDSEYPHDPNTIGVYGYDAPQSILRDFAVHKDLMSYCRPLWISDYTYMAVLNWHASAAAMLAARGEPHRSLLVWGRIGAEGVVLEPSFEIIARPSLPNQTGPYSLEGTDAAGRRVFNLSFAGAQVDHMETERHFAFVVPLSGLNELATIRLRAGGREAVVSRPPPVIPSAAVSAVIPSAARDLQVMRGNAGRARIQWNAKAYPAALIRDAGTGEILSIARGGAVDVAARSAEVEILLSDGVSSVRQTLRVRQ